MERTIISFDYAIKDILRDKANFDILSGFLTELLEKPVIVQEVLESEGGTEVIPFSQNLDPLSNVPKDIHPEYFLILPRKFEDDDKKGKKPKKSKFDE
jgi:hypothetical protein